MLDIQLGWKMLAERYWVLYKEYYCRTKSIGELEPENHDATLSSRKVCVGLTIVTAFPTSDLKTKIDHSPCYVLINTVETLSSISDP